MSAPPTLSGITRSLLVGKWRDAIMGGLSLLLVMCLGWVASDVVASRDKLRSIPDAAQIVTLTQANQRFAAEDSKIEANALQTHDGLVRIESKIDTLVMSMATRRREQARGPVDEQVYPTPYASSRASEKPTLYSK